MDLKQLEDAYYRSRVLSQDQYAGVIRLLEIFARQLSAVTNRITLRKTTGEAPTAFRADAVFGAMVCVGAGGAITAETLKWIKFGSPRIRFFDGEPVRFE
jgi:hypothetical protein